MQLLSQCEHALHVWDSQSGQKIQLLMPQNEQWEWCFYRFDAQRDFMPGDTSPDGVLLVRTPKGGSVVCFIEMKISGGHWDAIREQLEMGITHFAPLKHACQLMTHGDLHHRRWNNEDVLEVSVESDHQVWGVAIVTRRGARSPHFSPKNAISLCGKPIRFVTVLVPEKQITLRKLFQRATIPV